MDTNITFGVAKLPVKMRLQKINQNEKNAKPTNLKNDPFFMEANSVYFMLLKPVDNMWYNSTFLVWGYCLV